MLFHSRFAQEDVELERGVILEEIGMYEDTPCLLYTSDVGVCCDRLLHRLAPADGADEIIARDPDCGDAQEQDYVEALSQHEVAQFFQSRCV